MSRRSWNVISTFWEQGGRIKSGNDYLFVICLLSLVYIVTYTQAEPKAYDFMTKHILTKSIEGHDDIVLIVL